MTKRETWIKDNKQWVCDYINERAGSDTWSLTPEKLSEDPTHWALSVDKIKETLELYLMNACDEGETR